MLLSVPSKIMESCVSETVVRHVFQNNLITDKQWPTVTGILLNYCSYTSQKSGDQAINVNKVVSLAFVDFRNAFDRRVYFTLFYFISWILSSGEKSRTRRPRNDSCCLIFCWFGLQKYPQPLNSDISAFLCLILLQHPWFESVFHQKSFSVPSFGNTNTVFCHSICRILWVRHATKNQRLKHYQTARM